MANSTIARTLAECRTLGWPAAIVEKWVAMPSRRVDLFGLVDVLALAGINGAVGIQACGASGDAAAHVRKALASPYLIPWLESGLGFEIWAWRKVGPRGKRKTWQRRTIVFDLVPGTCQVRLWDSTTDQWIEASEWM